MYILLKIAGFLLGNIPPKAGYSLFDIFSTLAFYLSGTRKANLKKNLSMATGRTEITDSIMLNVYRNYGRYYFDLFTRREDLAKRVYEPDGVPSMADSYAPLLENHNGLIVVSAHLGNWDAAGAYLSSIFPGKVNVVVEKLSGAMYHWFRDTRERFGMKILYADDAKAIIGALKNGEIIVLLADRDIDKNGTVTDFFGAKAHIPTGPANLSIRYGAPIVFGSLLRDDERFVLRRPDAVISADKAGGKKSVEELTGEIVKILELMISAHPEQWCMLQKVWTD